MFALLRFFLALFSSLFKSKSRLEAENAALRRQLIVLQRKVPVASALVSFWTSKEALQDWHMTIYHKHAKDPAYPDWRLRLASVPEMVLLHGSVPINKSSSER
jgi:hypothetical protein